MLNILINKIKSYSYKRICFIWDKVYNFLIMLFMLIAFVSGFLMAKDYMLFFSLAIKLFITALLIYILAIFTRIIIKKAIENILYEDIDFYKYIRCLEFIKNNSEGRRLVNINNIYLILAEAEVLFFKGEFQKSIVKLKEIENQKMSRAFCVKLSYLKFNNYLFLKNIDEVNKIIYSFEELNKKGQNSNLKRFVRELNSMVDILYNNKYVENTSFSESNNNRSKLPHLYLDLYFNALNKKIVGEDLQAKKFFKELSEYEDELFIVREAKRELYNLELRDGGKNEKI